MRIASAKALEAIDLGCAVVRRCAGWAGVLALTALPARLLLVLLLWEAWKLGDQAGSRGDALTTLAWLAVAGWLVSLAGRLVFVHACRIAAESERPAPAAVLRVPWTWMWALLRPAILLELLFWLTLPTLLFAPLLLLAAGMCAIQAPDAGSGVLAPLRTLVTRTPWLPLVRLGFCFVPALALAILAVIQGAGIAAWAAEALPWVEPGTWTTLLTWRDPLFLMLACAGGTLLLEPFWLAALVALDRQARSRSTGDDLRAWFASLRSSRLGGQP
jgi:hypothetical protein